MEPNCSNEDEESTYLPFQFKTILIAMFTAVIVGTIVMGNLAMIVAVQYRRKPGRVNGCLLTSLAIADLCIGIFILPFSALQEARGDWAFGEVSCRIWLWADVWLCTASIYNLVAISCDRYSAITKPLSYQRGPGAHQGVIITVIVWLIALAVAMPSITVWLIAEKSGTLHGMIGNESTEIQLDVLTDCQCSAAHFDGIYVLMSAICSFYIPIPIIFTVYINIYRRIRIVARTWLQGYLNVDVGSGRTTRGLTTERKTSCAAQSEKSLRIHRGYSMSPEYNRKRRLSVNSTTAFAIGADNSPYLMTSRRSSTISRHDILRHKRSLEETDNRIIEKSVASPVLLRPTRKISAPLPNRQSTLPEGREFQILRELRTSAVADLKGTDPIVHTSRGSFRPPLERWPRIEENDESSHIIANTADGNLNFQYADNPSPLSYTLQTDTPGSRPLTPGENSVFFSENTPMPNSTDVLAKSVQTNSPPTRTAADPLSTESQSNITCWQVPKKYQRRLIWEIQTLKSVAMVTGCFILCWSGFSIIYVIKSLRGYPSDFIFSLFTWLGYCNSALNPLVYGLFNRDFRQTCIHIAHVGSAKIRHRSKRNKGVFV